MNLERIFHEVKAGRKLSGGELSQLKTAIVKRNGSPYELSQAVLTYCLLSPPDPKLADSIVALVSDYIQSHDEWQVTCAESILLALTTDWHFGEKLGSICKVVVSRWKDPKFEILFRQCSIVLGELSLRNRNSELFEILRSTGLAAVAAGNRCVAEMAAVGCRVATEGAMPSSLRAPNDVSSYLQRVHFQSAQ